MRRQGEDARRAILAAAEQEFAAHGLAGARVDRIAVAAAASKERLYAYFGDKQALFDEITDVVLGRISDAVSLDASDLPGWTAGLVDYFHAHPEDVRLAFWIQLEPAAGDPGRQTEREAAALAKVRIVRAGQDAGLIDSTWAAADLLQLLLSISIHWALHPLGPATVIPTDADRARDRRNAREAAERLVTPKTETPRRRASSETRRPADVSNLT